jgi:hypothetical protein
VNSTEVRGRARRKLPVLGAFLLSTTVALACGDKLMLVMRLRLAATKTRTPASHPCIRTTRSAETPIRIRQLQLQPAVKRAGHRFQLIEDAARLDQALKIDKYDLVFADVSVGRYRRLLWRVLVTWWRRSCR